MNLVVLIGRLTHDPELRYTNSGTAVASFTLAVDRAKKDDGPDFIPIVVWQKQAELCAEYLKKGRLTAIQGRMQTRSYEKRDGQKAKVTEVVADSVRFLDRGDQSGKPSEAPKPQQPASPSRFDDDPFADSDAPISDDDLPF